MNAANHRNFLNSAVNLGNVLFATDFTEQSMCALPMAMSLAEHYEGTLAVVHIRSNSNALEIPETQRSAFAKEIENKVIGSGRSAIEILPGEAAWPEVTNFTKLYRTDVIVAGIHGEHGIEKLLNGSSMAEFMAISAVPMLIAGPRCTTTASFNTVLYATNLSATAAHALPYALSLAETYAAPLLALYVDEGSSDIPPSEAFQKATDFFRKQSLYYGYSDSDQSEVVVKFGEKYSTILETATARNASCIVMGEHHRTGLLARALARLPNDPAYEVACKAKCPVLAVPF